MDNLSLLRNERELAKLNIEKRQMDHLVRHIKHAETRNKQFREFFRDKLRKPEYIEYFEKRGVITLTRMTQLSRTYNDFIRNFGFDEDNADALAIYAFLGAESKQKQGSGVKSIEYRPNHSNSKVKQVKKEEKELESPPRHVQGRKGKRKGAKR